MRELFSDVLRDLRFSIRGLRRARGFVVVAVLSLAVTNRTREIGVRIAMGAIRGRVIRGVLWDALRMAGFRAGAPHHGVLILPHTLPNREPGRIARALAAWHGRWETAGHPGRGFIDFVA